MNIVHLSIHNSGPSGYAAVNRLHNGLIEEGVNSLILTGSKIFGNRTIISAPPPGLSLIKKTISSMRYCVDSRSLSSKHNRNQNNFFPNLRPNYISRYTTQPDREIVHIHFPIPDYIPIFEIRKINKPIIWTLHDSWPFTGGCLFPGNCAKYETGCGKCPVIESRKNNDLSRKILLAKKKHWDDANLTLIAPSRWMADRAKNSYLFRRKRIELIPNGLDLSVFHPVERTAAKKVLGLPENKKIILFGARDCSLSHKGYDHLIGSLTRLHPIVNAEEIHLATFGSSSSAGKRLTKYRQHHLGVINDERLMAALYSAADLFVAPYHFDSFGQTLIESMACGTPVVAFGIGGPIDIIDHKINGYLAMAYNTEDLAAGIGWILNYRNKKTLSQKARKKVQERFNISRVAKSHIALYQEILGSQVTPY